MEEQAMFTDVQRKSGLISYYVPDAPGAPVIPIGALATDGDLVFFRFVDLPPEHVAASCRGTDLYRAMAACQRANGTSSASDALYALSSLRRVLLSQWLPTESDADLEEEVDWRFTSCTKHVPGFVPMKECAEWTVVRLSGRLSGEGVSIGVIAWRRNQAFAKFVTRWERVMASCGGDAAAVDLARAEALQLSVPNLVPADLFERLTVARGPIEYQVPQVSPGDLHHVLNEGVRRYLSPEDLLP